MPAKTGNDKVGSCHLAGDIAGYRPCNVDSSVLVLNYWPVLRENLRADKKVVVKRSKAGTDPHKVLHGELCVRVVFRMLSSGTGDCTGGGRRSWNACRVTGQRFVSEVQVYAVPENAIVLAFDEGEPFGHPGMVDSDSGQVVDPKTVLCRTVLLVRDIECFLLLVSAAPDRSRTVSG